MLKNRIISIISSFLVKVWARQLENKIVEIRNMKIRIFPNVFPPIRTISTDLLLDAIDHFVKAGQKLLDLGTGSGVLAIYAAKKGAKVIATDIMKEAVVAAKYNAKINNVKIDVRIGNLFDPVKGIKFDIIVFNPPYFLGEPRDSLDYAIYSGKRYDIIVKFILMLRSYLKKTGFALITLSNLIDERIILSIAERKNITPKIYKQAKGLYNEKITVYLLTPIEG